MRANSNAIWNRMVSDEEQEEEYLSSDDGAAYMDARIATLETRIMWTCTCRWASGGVLSDMEDSAMQMVGRRSARNLLKLRCRRAVDRVGLNLQMGEQKRGV